MQEEEITQMCLALNDSKCDSKLVVARILRFKVGSKCKGHKFTPWSLVCVSTTHQRSLECQLVITANCNSK